MKDIRRLDSGRIVKLEDSGFSEFVNGDWTPLSESMYLGEYWNAVSIGESDLPVASSSVKSN